MKDETRVNHPPAIELPDDNYPLNLPIFQNVKWETETVLEGERIARGERPGFFYSRLSNPSVRQLELMLAQLQRRDECMVTASGVNAVAQTLIGLTRAGDHVVFFTEGYGPTRQIIRGMLARFGVTHSMLSIDDLAGLERTLSTRKTRLVWFESPTNPINKIADIEAITRLARAHGALTAIDNTAAGFHQHGEFDIDLFVHSLTKFATGAGDVMGGAVIARRELIDQLRSDFRLFGAHLDALSASIMVRGLKTYFVRYRQQSASAQTVAEFLEHHPACTRVRYPGLASQPKAELARRQMREFGSVICFDLVAGYEAGRKFTESLQLFARTPSFGSTESLAMPPQMMQPKDFSPEDLALSSIGPGTVRLSIGLEDIEDLKADLTQALETIHP
ncbi:MAG: aminotransferase class I/II-fold pyridoxal phosphate-dependent enzyme [Gammaproteobacteria bacterium]|nr:aminotransferase class I/II-fold pyridoxal phosphate-dependent enzyme [Gammaproteobacteria bacterium]